MPQWAYLLPASLAAWVAFSFVIGVLLGRAMRGVEAPARAHNAGHRERSLSRAK